MRPLPKAALDAIEARDGYIRGQRERLLNAEAAIAEWRALAESSQAAHHAALVELTHLREQLTDARALLVEAVRRERQRKRGSWLTAAETLCAESAQKTEGK